ncbi:hypothetical protein [Bradyrhizobium sp. USDA 4350]
MMLYVGQRIDDVGRQMVENYLKSGRGERADIRSTIVDMVTDAGHFVTFERKDAETSFDAGNALRDEFVIHSPEVETRAAVAIGALKAYASQKGFDFDNILWLAKDHLRAETMSRSTTP